MSQPYDSPAGQTVLTPAFDSKTRTQLGVCLLLIRLGIASVFLIWTIDKFVNPEHAAVVFKKFYKIDGLSETLSYVVGAAQMALVVAFIVGFLRTWTYGLILIMHAISTFSSWEKYIDPWTYPHLLFYAAIPMLSACVALWVLRRFDIYSIDACWEKEPEVVAPHVN